MPRKGHFYFPFTDTLEIRGDIRYLNDDDKIDYKDSYSGRERNFDQDITGFNDIYSETHSDNLIEEWSGSTFSIGFGVNFCEGEPGIAPATLP